MNRNSIMSLVGFKLLLFTAAVHSFHCSNGDSGCLLLKGSCELWFQIKYTQGDMEVARKYFGQAIKLNSNNMRALFGYYLVCIYGHKVTDGLQDFKRLIWWCCHDRYWFCKAAGCCLTAIYILLHLLSGTDIKGATLLPSEVPWWMKKEDQGHWLGLMLCVPVSAMTLMVRWQERHLACWKLHSTNPRGSFPDQVEEEEDLEFTWKNSC